MNVLFASPEVAPFAKTGGLADVSGSLPKALGEISCRVNVIQPFYKSVKDMNLNLDAFSIGEYNFHKYKTDDVEYVFLINDEYYDRDNLYSEPEADYPDNDLRFSYFSKAVVAFATSRDPKPDIIHCNDWQTGLVPLYLKLVPPSAGSRRTSSVETSFGKEVNIKTLFTIHNIGYQGLFPREAIERIGMPQKFYRIDGMEYYGKISFLKAGIVYSSAISTVSRGYAREILTPEFGCGMDGILRTRVSDIYGIVNGVDYSDWNPRLDKHIIVNYDSDSVDKKNECKKDLIKSANLPPETQGRPLLGVISRLAYQKGVDLIVESAEEIIDLGASIIILGTGDRKYNNLARQIAEQHPEYISSHITFDNTLAHKIEAGCDMFVMPSRYEPCGLNQLYSMRYGTLPIVRKTGGLDDTVIDIYADREKGNGIKFFSATKRDLIDAVQRAIELYKDKNLWHKIQKRIMNLDFSWKTSASHYKELYEKILV